MWNAQQSTSLGGPGMCLSGQSHCPGGQDPCPDDQGTGLSARGTVPVDRDTRLGLPGILDASRFRADGQWRRGDPHLRISNI